MLSTGMVGNHFNNNFYAYNNRHRWKHSAQIQYSNSYFSIVYIFFETSCWTISIDITLGSTQRTCTQPKKYVNYWKLYKRNPNLLYLSVPQKFLSGSQLIKLNSQHAIVNNKKPVAITLNHQNMISSNTLTYTVSWLTRQLRQRHSSTSPNRCLR